MLMQRRDKAIINFVFMIFFFVSLIMVVLEVNNTRRFYPYPLTKF